jgi:hypothetical protein
MQHIAAVRDVALFSQFRGATSMNSARKRYFDSAHDILCRIRISFYDRVCCFVAGVLLFVPR